ncbi:MAG: hypothetical protein IPK96_07460 [Flammeovirgaceae bacterium]|jgi:hypothetical protein|nr:hypothetical protein [Flammeovirgaceae bacterium]
MKKLIVRFVLVQCILLSIGYSNQYALASQDCGISSIVLDNSITNFDSVKNNHSIVTNSAHSFKIDVAEIEEEKDKFFSFKKYLTGSYSFSILFSDLIPGHFFGLINKSEHIANPTPELTSNSSYITFQVFRI